MLNHKLIWTLVAAGLCVGCAPEPQRQVRGQFAREYGSRIDQAVALARTTDGRAFVSRVDTFGRFQLALPAGAHYRVALAVPTSATGYRVISNVMWPSANGRAHWVHIGGGAAFDMGTIHPVRLTPLLGGVGRSWRPLDDSGACGDAQGACENATDEVAGAQECQSDDADVGNVDDGQVTDDVDVDQDSPAGNLDNEIDQPCTPAP